MRLQGDALALEVGADDRDGQRQHCAGGEMTTRTVAPASPAARSKHAITHWTGVSKTAHVLSRAEQPEQHRHRRDELACHIDDAHLSVTRR